MGMNGAPNTSPTATALEIVTAERDAARQQMMQLNQETINRALPRVNELIDSLNQIAGQAVAGNPIAKLQLGLFFKALDEARAAASGQPGIPILRR